MLALTSQEFAFQRITENMVHKGIPKVMVHAEDNKYMGAE
jgi:hypothetical protein